MENKDTPAFPNLDPHIDVPDTGLTKREYFAGLAMQGMLAAGFNDPQAMKEAAKRSIAFADELLKQLNP